MTHLFASSSSILFFVLFRCVFLWKLNWSARWHSRVDLCARETTRISFSVSRHKNAVLFHKEERQGVRFDGPVVHGVYPAHLRKHLSHYRRHHPRYRKQKNWEYEYVFSSNSWLIGRYNERSTDWNNYGIDLFRNALLRVQYNNENYSLFTSEEADGPNYPLRDSCDYIGDPGCVETKVFYYYTTIPVYNNTDVPLVLFSGSRLLMNTTLHYVEDSALTKKELGCEGASQYV